MVMAVSKTTVDIAMVMALYGNGHYRIHGNDIGSVISYSVPPFLWIQISSYYVIAMAMNMATAVACASALRPGQ